MVAHEIRSHIEAIERDVALFEETNFAARAEEIDDLEFKVLDRLESLAQATDEPAPLILLRRHAEALKRRLAAVDDALFRRIRGDIRAGRYGGTALRSLIDMYCGPASAGRRSQDEPGYDSRDVFLDGLLLTSAVPTETKAREPEMVQYQPTPARIILELAEKSRLTSVDIFYDVGSGLGRVPILVNLLSGAAARGIEVQPAYCDYARACAAELNLPRVEFTNTDARAADLSEGTVFYLYTPFTGGMLQEVLTRLQGAARGRMIRLFTYGPCTPDVAGQNWLERVGQCADHLDELAAFESTIP